MKIFGVGWPKTGTTTLQRCFEILGYSYYGYKPSLVGKPELAMFIARRFETFKDWPWSLYYKELDERYPGSKFVLTTRETESWLLSYRNWVTRHQPTSAMKDVRKKVYGSASPTEEQAIERYERHNFEVKEYFSDRPGDLLVVDWEQGDGWEQLCTFLDKPVPNMGFPHANKGGYHKRTTTPP